MKMKKGKGKREEGRGFLGGIVRGFLAVALCAVGLSAFAAEPDAVQLWKDGPYFATCNVGDGATVPGDYGALYTFDDNKAADAAESLGEGWRLPTKAEWDALLTNCGIGTWTEQNGVKGRLFTGTGDYASNSIFLPAAGNDRGDGREGAGGEGYYWSSTEKDAGRAWRLDFNGSDAGVSYRERSYGFSVRAVKDPPPPVTYLDWDEANKKLTNAVCTAYEVVTNGMNAFEAGRTYVVEDDVTCMSRIAVKGTPANPTRLILCDGAELVAKKGVEVKANSTTTNALIICGQKGGTGALTAAGNMASQQAGIGGSNYQSVGIVTINGGIITAIGGSSAAGIGNGGGYDERIGGAITINGGMVTATGGGSGAAGIGGGDGPYMAGIVITINGGEITAVGSEGGEAIGDGVDRQAESTITFGAKFVVKAGDDAASAVEVPQEDYEKDHSAVYVHIAPPEISSVSAEGWLDLTVGDRIAQDEETLVADPKWGNGKKAFVKIDGEDPAREYPELSIDKWFTSALTAGRYGMTFTSGDTNETAVFWKTGDDWVVQDLPPSSSEGIFFESGKTHLILGTTTFIGDAPLEVEDGAKFEYGTGAGFIGGKLEMPRRYRKETIEGGLYRIVEAIKGCADNPWDVGVGVEAYTNGTDNLVIVGAGIIADLSEIPADVKRGIAAITVADATDAAAGSFYGMDGITVTLPDNWQGELPDEKGTWCGAKNVELTRWPMAVKNVKPQQRYPWNGLVDVTYDVSGTGSVKVVVSVMTNGVKAVANPTVTGDVTADLGAGKELKERKITWDAKADFGDAGVHEKIKVKLTVSPVESD